MPETPDPPVTPSPRPDNDAHTEARELARFMASQDASEIEAASWFVRRQDGLNADEEAAFQRWLQADPAHAGAFERWGEVWRGAARVQPAPAMPPTPPRLSMPHSTRRAWLIRMGHLAPQAAAAGVAAGVVGSGWWAWGRVQGQPVYSRALATTRGQQASLALPDGSEIKLDAASRATIVFHRDRREVHLEAGQALFSVRADAARPFHVIAGAMRITVVGTRFTVRHAGGEAGVTTAVQHGHVKVARVLDGSTWAVASPEAVDLVAGQALTADAQGRFGPVVALAPGRFADWDQGRVVFDGTPLAEAIAEFERYADTGLVVTDADVAAMRLSGSFELRQSASFARALVAVLPVRLRRRDDGRTEVIRAR